MLVLATQAAVFAATCYVVAEHEGGACVVVDPGVGVADAAQRLVAAHGLRPVAVAATHAHPDHVWDAARLQQAWDVPVLLARADQDRLADPAEALGPALADAFGALTADPWVAPEQVAVLGPDGLDVGELHLATVAAPGHTPGSTVLIAPGAPASTSVLPTPLIRDLPAPSAIALTGDVLFAGSIGRVDLPGGDPRAMSATLQSLVRRLPADAWLLPGHGPITTTALERARNPYLRPGWLARGTV